MQSTACRMSKIKPEFRDQEKYNGPMETGVFYFNQSKYWGF